jgi:hypothetical protein
MAKLYSLAGTFVKRFFIFYILYSLFSYGTHWLLDTQFSTSKCLWMGTMIALVSIAYEFIAPRISKS